MSSWITSATKLESKVITAPTEKNIQTAAIYNATEANKIVSSLNGTPWVLDAWYRQELDTDDSPKTLDENTSRALQQYVEIKNAVMYVTAPFSLSYAEESNTSRLPGTGQVLSSIAPHVSDIFVAPMVTGKVGLFEVIRSVPLDYLSTTPFEVEYTFMRYVTSEDLTHLSEKTIKTLFYVPGETTLSSCLLSEEELYEIQTAKSLIGEMITWWYDDFYNKETKTGLLPNEETFGFHRYDYMVVKFWKAIITAEEREDNPILTQYPIASTHHLKRQSSIWDIMLGGNRRSIYRISSDVMVVDIGRFSTDRIPFSIGYSGANELVMLANTMSLHGSIGDTGSLPYVFSSAFYAGEPENMTDIDRAVYDTLHGRTVPCSVLISLFNELSSQTLLERFYAIPVLVWLIKTTLGG